MEYKITEYSIYSSGRRTDSRGVPRQEDCIYPPVGHAKTDDTLFVVCDGMGHNGSGIYASSTVCQAVSYYIRQLPGDKFTVADMEGAINAAYEALDRCLVTDSTKPSTTLCVLKLHSTGYMTAHMGNTRVYHIRPGLTPNDTHILYRTVDHTLANYLVSKGEMTPQEALKSDKRHIIIRGMQPRMDRRCQADIYESKDIRAGDYFMLCTDGMLEYITDENICAIFSAAGGNDKNKAALLTKVTNNNTDNHSAIIVHITDVFNKVKTDSTRYDRPNHILNMDNNHISHASGRSTNHGGSQAKSRKIPTDIMPLFIKFLFLLMALLVVIMIIYYLFIRKNETLQTAGTAVDNIENSDADAEVYGYEITEQDMRNEAQPLPLEEETTESEPTETDFPIIDDSELLDVQEETTETAQPTDEPILQE